MSPSPCRALAGLSLLAFLAVASPDAIPSATAQTDQVRPAGPPVLPTREYSEPAAADSSVETAPSGAEAADRPAGPPSTPARQFAGPDLGAPTGAPSGAVAASEPGQAAADEPGLLTAPEQAEVDTTTPTDAAIQPLPDLAAEGTNGPVGGVDPSALGEAFDARPADIVQEDVATVPEGALPDAVELLTGETGAVGTTGAAEEIIGETADVFDTPAEPAPAEQTAPEQAASGETVFAETPALAEEPVQTASAAIAEPAEPEAPAAPVEGGAAATGSGRIVYAVFDNTLLETRLFRVRASQGETPEDVSAALDALGAAPDDWIVSASDGEWLLLGTQRFDDACAGWACLAVVPADLSSGEAVRTSADVVHPEGIGAIAAGGALIVYPSSGGPHDMDLWAITRQGEIWSDPLLLTTGSPYAYNDLPALSADGAWVVFDCGDQPYGQEGTAICEAATDGSAFRVVLTPQEAPTGIDPGGAHHRPAYAPDGSIVFQSRWTEGLWRVAHGAAPVPVATFSSEASPCVLPDGRIASLWSGREGSGGLSELKVMTPDGTSYVMLLTALQIEDIGCGG